MADDAYYYAHTLAALTKVLGKSVVRIENPEGKPTREHLAWMIEKIAQFDRSSMDDAIRAGQWVGRMLLAAEMHRFWNHHRSRELLCADHRAGFDKPHMNRSA